MGEWMEVKTHKSGVVFGLLIGIVIGQASLAEAASLRVGAAKVDITPSDLAGLTEKSLLIDFQRNQVTIARGVKAELRANSTRIHGLHSVPGLITLATRVGGVPVLAVIDTGAERTLGNLALRDALRKRRMHGVMAQMTSVYGATKEVEVGEILIAPPIVIDSLRINDVAIVFGEFHIFNVWRMQDQPAMIIGMDVLGTVASLSIDFKNQDVYVGSLPAKGDILSVMRGMNGDSAQRK